MTDQGRPRRISAAPKRAADVSGFTKEEIERRALETARRVLATPKKPAGPKAPRQRPVVTRGKKRSR